MYTLLTTYSLSDKKIKFYIKKILNYFQLMY